MSNDFIQRFLIEDFAVRGQIVRLEQTWEKLLACADYPQCLQQLLAQAATATAVLGAGLKHDARLTLQINGNGPITLLNMQISNELTMRGLIRWQGDIDPQLTLPELCSTHSLSLTLSAARRKSLQQDYQGIASLHDDSITQSVEDYMHQSEQVQTRLYFAQDDHTIAGLLLQQLPEGGGSENWDECVALMSTLRDAELIADDPQTLLRKLYANRDVRLFDARPVVFKCSCSNSRVESVLRSLGFEECQAVLKEESCISVTCEYCNQQYTYNEKQVAELFFNESDETPPQIH